MNRIIILVLGFIIFSVFFPETAFATCANDCPEGQYCAEKWGTDDPDSCAERCYENAAKECVHSSTKACGTYACYNDFPEHCCRTKNYVTGLGTGGDGADGCEWKDADTCDLTVEYPGCCERVPNTPTPGGQPTPTKTPTPTFGPTLTPTPTPCGADPIGYLDGANCSSFGGWSGDPDNINQAIDVHFYANGPAGSGTFVGATTANVQAESGVCTALGGTAAQCNVCPADQPQCKHRFGFTTPSSPVNGVNLFDGADHIIYAYGLNLPGTCGNNVQLTNTFTINCPSLTPTPTPTIAPTPTTGLTPTLAPVTVSGRVYLDPTANATAGIGSQCSDADSNPLQLSYIQLNPASSGPTGTVDASGNWSILVQSPDTSEVLQLNDKGTYLCQCPSGGPGNSCRYSSANLDTANGGYLTGWNFYVTDILAKWWQALWSDVHSQSDIIANVPASNYLLTDAPSSGGPGVATTDSGSVTINGDGSLSTTGNKYSDGISAANWRYNYDSLWRNAGRPTQAGNPGGWSGSGTPSAGVSYLNGSLNLGSNWNLTAGSYVIFVNGAVFIDHNIKLADPQTDFLAIIASGNITMGENIGRTTFKTAVQLSADAHGLANLEGAYLTDGNFTVESTGDPGTEKQLVIYGSVAGGMDLSRDVEFNRNLGQNNDKPPVAVIWNPFLLLNAPEELKDTYTDWREVAP